jgi:outer membrane murein-binding lipoprotein Lpp
VKAALWTTVAVLVAATMLAAPASAATPTERKLTKKVTTLQRQVKTMQKQVKTLQRQMRDVQSVAAASLIYSACATAATADAFQGTWETIDRVGAKLTPPFDQYGPQTAIADPLNSCQRLEIQRQPNTVPPTTDVFAALLNLFR